LFISQIQQPYFKLEHLIFQYFSYNIFCFRRRLQRA